MRTHLIKKLLLRNYIIQTDATSCAPIALMNSHYYKYGKFPKTNIEKLRKLCETDVNGEGTHRWNILNPKFTREYIMQKPRYQINKYTEMKAYILLYSYGKRSAHYILVTHTDANTVWLYNYYDVSKDKYLHKRMTYEEFKKNILVRNPRHQELDYPVAWEIIT